MTAAVRAEVAGLRTVYQATHRRTSDIAANLEIGWSRFGEFAGECGVLSQAQRIELAARVRAALLRGAAAQAEHRRELNPLERYLAGLRSALAAGAVHVSTVDDEPPPDAGSWGWRKRLVGVGVELEERWEPRGDRSAGWTAPAST